MNIDIDLNKLREQGLFLGIPMYGGLCYGATTKSLIDLAVLCKHYGIPLRTYFISNESLIPRARNYITDTFIRSECDTMIFIDADVSFEAMDVLAMWHIMNESEDIDVFCAPYPKKTIAWEKIKSAVDKGAADEDANMLENFVGDYVFSVVKEGSYSVNEPLEVLESGTGFMLIKKNTLTKFIEKYPHYQYTPDHTRTEDFDGSRKIGMFFHCEIDEKSNRYLSEDYWFCQKTREAGMKVWLAPWIKLRHTGTYTFAGSLSHIAAIGETINVGKKGIKKKR